MIGENKKVVDLSFPNLSMLYQSKIFIVSQVS